MAKKKKADLHRKSEFIVPVLLTIISAFVPTVIPMGWFLVLLCSVALIGCIIWFVIIISTRLSLKKYRMYVFISVILVLSGIGTYFRVAHQYTKDYPIIISPSKITTQRGDSDSSKTNFDTVSSFTVYNRSDEPIYSAWVQIYVVERLKGKSDVQVRIATDDGRNFLPLLGPERNKSFDTDVLKITAIDPKNNQTMALLLFRCLMPKQPNTFKFFAHFPSGTNIKNHKLTFSLKAITYSDKPWWVGIQGEDGAFEFVLPIRCRIIWNKDDWPITALQKKE